MPLLVAQPVAPPPPPPPPGPRLIVDMTWTSPDGTTIDLMHRDVTGPGALVMLDGMEGHGAAPREVTRRALATGGAYGRWSHMAERPLALPIHLHADDPESFLAWRRQFTLLFTSTTPSADVPRPGVLRVIRADSSWREINAIYTAGLSWLDNDGYGIIADPVVVELLALDPWWYGPQQFVLSFEVVAGRDYFHPYETVSPATANGATTVNVIGDGPALPKWVITGPAEQVTAEIVGGPHWTFGEIEAGETITIDVLGAQVYDNTGASRFGDLAFPGSELFSLPPGENEMEMQLTGGLDGVSGITMTYRPRFETA